MYKNLPPLAKQLLGAAAGTLIALALYGAYTVVGPQVSALASLLSPSTQASSKFTDADRAQRQAEIVAHAKEIIVRELGKTQ